MRRFAAIEAPVQGLEKEGPIWVEALPVKEYHTKQYGKVPVTIEDLDEMIQNFKNNVRGQEIAVDFAHRQDPTKGEQAAGWYRDFAIRPSSADPSIPALYAQVEFTDDARKEGKEGKWRYFSLEWDDNYEDNDGNKFKNVVIGGGLTNRPIAKNTLPINFSENMWDDLTDEQKEEFKAEHAPEEHSEPGTGTQPPPPRTDQDPDPAVEGGWRRETPPIEQEQFAGVGWSENANKEKGGNKLAGEEVTYSFGEKDAHELLSVLDLPGDAKPAVVVEAVKVAAGELKKFRDNQSAAEQEKEFSERYPEYYEEHKKLMEKSRDNDAKIFSEGIAVVKRPEGKGLVKTRQQLSVVAREKVQETHKKFADGSITIDDFEECIRTITSGGIVEFGEVGTSGEEDDVPEFPDNATGVAGAKKAFAELMNAHMKENPDDSEQQAMEAVATKYPELFAQTRATVAG